MSGVRVELKGWGWRHAARKAWAVRGLDLRLDVGERVLLLGASGAGKSTLLAGIAGLLDPDRSGEQEGRLLLDGVPARAARFAAVRSGRARTGLLLQDPQAQTVLARCGDDVAFGLENHAVGVEEIWPRVDAALKQVGFPYGREHPTGALSGGERQRLALAGALALAPDLLLLDEPTAMLDPQGADLVRSAVSAALLGSEAGCLVVEHRVEPWLPLVDRVVVIGAGDVGVIADGHPDDVFAAAAGELAGAGVWTPGLAARQARDHARPDSPAGELLVRAERITVTRPTPARPGRRPVLTGLSFDLHRGRATCLTGPNGSGKSTLALAVSGLEPVSDGRLEAQPVLSRGLGPEPYRWRARELVSRIGTVFQDPQHQFVAATVRQELEVGPRVGGRSGPGVDDLLERLRLSHLSRANPFTLSGGEQRRLSVATVLATAPDLLVLDEPTFGQDARTWAGLAGLLGELLDDGAGLLVATHDLDLVTALSAGDPGIEL